MRPRSHAAFLGAAAHRPGKMAVQVRLVAQRPGKIMVVSLCKTRPDTLLSSARPQAHHSPKVFLFSPRLKTHRRHNHYSKRVCRCCLGTKDKQKINLPETQLEAPCIIKGAKRLKRRGADAKTLKTSEQSSSAKAQVRRGVTSKKTKMS